MKAVVVNPEGTGVEIVANKEMRPLETGEALVQIEYCGVCHTDLHVAHGDFGILYNWSRNSLPYCKKCWLLC